MIKLSELILPYRLVRRSSDGAMWLLENNEGKWVISDEYDPEHMDMAIDDFNLFLHIAEAMTIGNNPQGKLEIREAVRDIIHQMMQDYDIEWDPCIEIIEEVLEEFYLEGDIE